jgi:hypothetical protein
MMRGAVLVVSFGALGILSCGNKPYVAKEPTADGQVKDDIVILSDGPRRDKAISTPDPYAPCTDPEECCSSSEMVCTGDPEKGMICRCSRLWDCSADLKTCNQPMPVPEAQGAWTCVWSEYKYTCTKECLIRDYDLPTQGSWACEWLSKENRCDCTASFPPNPSNEPMGANYWECSVENETTLVCQKN